MKKFTNKSLLALSISAIMTTALLSACGSDSDDNAKDPDVVHPNPAEQRFEVKAFADNADFTPVTVATWQPSPLLPSEPDKSDEYVWDMDVQNGQVVTINFWHNSIVKIDDEQSSVAQVSPELFATLLTAEHGVDSSADDIVSGASEHLLRDVQYSKDNKTMFALVATPRKIVPGDDTYGLFKVTLNADGSIPTTTIKGQPVAHRGGNVQRVADAKFEAMLALDNGGLLVSDDTNHAIRYYDQDFMLQEASSFALAENDELESWVADSTAVYLVIEQQSAESKTHRIEKRLLTDLTKVVKSQPMNDEVEGLVSHDQRLIAVTKGAVQLLNNDLIPIATTTYETGIEDFSVASDFSRVAVIDGNEALTLVDISADDLSIPIKVAFDKAGSFDAFTLADSGSLFYSNKPGEINKINLDQPMVALSDDKVVEQSITNLKAQQLNHGYGADAVRYDLSLPSKDANLPITYTWQSSHPSVIATDGKVTTPNDGQPVEVTLTLTGKSDDGKVSATRDFTFTVLPTSQVITTGTETNLSETLPFQTYNYNHDQFSNNTANTDGSLFALFSGQGITLLQRQGDNQVKTVVSAAKELIMPQSGALGLTDPEVQTVMWQGQDTLWVLMGDETGGALVKKTFSDLTNIEALTQQAKSEWTVVERYQHPVVTGFINTDKTHITIVSDKSNPDSAAYDYQVTTYDVTTGRVIADYSTDANLATENVTIDDSGKYVLMTTYDREAASNKLYRYVNGIKDSEIELDDYHFSGVMSADGNFIASGADGQLLLVSHATGDSPLKADNLRRVSFAREGYDGTPSQGEDYDKGDSFSVARAGNTIFVSYFGIGASAVDFSDFTKPVETQFIPYKNQYTLVPSSDGGVMVQLGIDEVGQLKVNVTSLK